MDKMLIERVIMVQGKKYIWKSKLILVELQAHDAAESQLKHLICFFILFEPLSSSFVINVYPPSSLLLEKQHQEKDRAYIKATNQPPVKDGRREGKICNHNYGYFDI
jgi:hypothetical protein